MDLLYDNNQNATINIRYILDISKYNTKILYNTPRKEKLKILKAVNIQKE